MAVDATGTPTTNFSFPTYNTAVDNPSGDGLNNIIADIDSKLQTELDAKVESPASIASGEAMIWNGSAWARSSVTRLTTVRPQDLGQDAASSGDVMTWNGSIWAPAAPSSAGVVQMDYAEITSDASTSASAEGSAGALITGNSVTYEAVPHLVSMWCTSLDATTSNHVINIGLFESTTLIKMLLYNINWDIEYNVGLSARFTPSAGSHTYSIRGWNASNGLTVGAGSGASGNKPPAYMQIVKL